MTDCCTTDCYGFELLNQLKTSSVPPCILERFFIRMKNHLYMVLFLFVWLSNSAVGYEEDNDFPREDYKTFFRDLHNALGVEQIVDTIGFYFRTFIRIGQAYTRRKFEYDWKDVKEKPTIGKVFRLLHKLTWVAISQSGVKLIQLLSQIQNFLLKFLRTKCDVYLGKDAALHPWNIMMQQDQQHVSFLVFIYGTGLSLILIKLLSWWNFMVYIAFGFLMYSFGGPYMVFKWLLCVTAFFWFIFDTVIKYPLHTALCILTLYALSYLRWVLPSLRSPPSENYVDSPPYPPRTNAQSTRNGRHVVEDNRRDFRILTSRIDGMERKTDLLNDRLERLARSMDVLTQSMSDDEGNEPNAQS